MPGRGPTVLRVALVIVLIIAATVHGAAQTSAASTVITDGNWAAPRWSENEAALFGGRPAARGDRSRMIAVKYSYYVVQYSVQRKNPVWVAHIDTAESVAAAGRRPDSLPEWDRNRISFVPDGNVVAFARRWRLDWVGADSFTYAISDDVAPQRATIDFKRDPRVLTRGHMASNVELKGQGDDPGGQLAQRESFSLANVCPQASGHNSPVWSAIEGDCQRAATQFGVVAVISGPVFRADRPLHHTNSSNPAAVAIPIPSHFFKILIVEIDGRREALGFLVEHQPGLKKADRFAGVKSVREIERFAGVNVMPALGRNDAVENAPSPRLLAFLQSN